MKIKPEDAGNYLRGMLILIRKDLVVNPEESGITRQIGKALDFEPGFVRSAIETVLINRNIPTAPPAFSDQRIARCFLIDGFHLAGSDGNIHPEELSILHETARVNNLEAFFAELVNKLPEKGNGLLAIEEIQKPGY